MYLLSFRKSGVVFLASLYLFIAVSDANTQLLAKSDSSQKNSRKRVKKKKRIGTATRAPASVSSYKFKDPHKEIKRAVRNVKLDRSMAPIPKQKWYKKLEVGLSKELCQDGEYFRSCFDISKKQCYQVLRRELNSCWSRKSIMWRMKKVRPRLEGVSMAFELGACAGQAYEKRLKSKIKKAPICHGNTSRWLGRSVK